MLIETIKNVVNLIEEGNLPWNETKYIACFLSAESKIWYKTYVYVLI